MAGKTEETSVMAFDALYTNNNIQKLKILLPYMDASIQKRLAVYIKYLELQYTIDYVKKHPFQICGGHFTANEKPDLQKLCKQLCLYSSKEEIRQLEQFQNMLKTMETFQEMSQTIALMQELFPEMAQDNTASQQDDSDSSSDSTAGPSKDGGFSMMDMLMNMLTPEQKEMYEMFQSGMNQES